MKLSFPHPIPNRSVRSGHINETSAQGTFNRPIEKGKVFAEARFVGSVGDKVLTRGKNLTEWSYSPFCVGLIAQIKDDERARQREADKSPP